MSELKRGSSSEGAQAREQAGKKVGKQASKQALGRHSVGAMPWRGLFFEIFIILDYLKWKSMDDIMWVHKNAQTL